MKNNTNRNIFRIVLGYYLLTGNFKGARNFAIAYFIMMLVLGGIVVGVGLTKRAESERREAYEMQVQAEKKAKERQEAKQYASEVLPAFVKQFKGKTMKGEFYDVGGLDSYGVKFKILNDSLLSYQISKGDDYPEPYSGRKPKWSAPKKVRYSIVPSDENDMFVGHQLNFCFENYKGELDVISSKNNKKHRFSTPLILKDADNLTGCFWD